MTVGIIGYGWVGKAMHKLFPDASIWDEYDRSHNTSQTSGAAYSADIVFICVPTPNLPNGLLDISLVEQCVLEVHPSSLPVIRSTVNPGTIDSLPRSAVYQPEYLGETPAHPMLDMATRPFLILGGDLTDTRKLIELYQEVYSANISIRQVTAYQAEVIKLTENRAIAFKVAQCQELYDVCEKAGVDYYTIRDAVYGDDPRFTLWFTFVYPDKRGFNSKCIPKDVIAWKAWAESIGYNPKLTKALLTTNNGYIKTNN